MREGVSQGAAFGADERARADVVAREPAVVHFEDVEDVLVGGFDGDIVIFFEMDNFLNDAIGANIRGGEGDGTIGHPKGGALGHVKIKEHGGFIGDVGAVHQPGFLLFHRDRHLGIERLRAKINLHRGQRRLRLGGDLWNRRIGRCIYRRIGCGLLATGQNDGEQNKDEQVNPLHADNLAEAGEFFNSGNGCWQQKISPNPHLTLTLSPPIGWERRGTADG